MITAMRVFGLPALKVVNSVIPGLEQLSVQCVLGGGREQRCQDA